MAAIVFPTSPTTNQAYSANGTTWIWDGTTWNAFTPAPSVAWTSGTLDSGNASGSTGKATSTTTAAQGIPSPYGVSGSSIVSNGSQWVVQGPVVPSGSVFLLYQASAPTGWTQVTSLNDYDLRLVSSAGGTTGGTTAYSTVFANQTPTIGATTLSLSQIPSHNHGVGNLNNGACNPSPSGNYGYDPGGIAGTATDVSVAPNGGSGSHTHSSTAVTLNVRYANMILCSKN